MNFLSASLSLTHKYAYILIVPHALFYSNRMFSSDCLECGPLEYQSFHNCTYECRYKLNANHSGGLFTFC